MSVEWMMPTRVHAETEDEVDLPTQTSLPGQSCLVVHSNALGPKLF